MHPNFNPENYFDRYFVFEKNSCFKPLDKHLDLDKSIA